MSMGDGGNRDNTSSGNASSSQSRSAGSLGSFSRLSSSPGTNGVLDHSCSSMMGTSSSSSSITMVERISSDQQELDFLIELFRQDQEDCQQFFVTTIPRKTDVCFKKVTHDGTVKWREAIKLYSLDHVKFPNWQDDLCDKIQRYLHQNAGIDRFLICRDDDGEPSNSTTSGNWCLATQQEIFDKTKQRFLDDRKPKNEQHGEKRKIGRPRLRLGRRLDLLVRRKRNQSGNDEVERNTAPNSSTVDLIASLREVLADYRQAIEQQQEQALPRVASRESSAALVDMLKDLQCINHFVRIKMEEALKPPPTERNEGTNTMVDFVAPLFHFDANSLIDQNDRTTQVGAFAESAQGDHSDSSGTTKTKMLHDSHAMRSETEPSMYDQHSDAVLYSFQPGDGPSRLPSTEVNLHRDDELMSQLSSPNTEDFVGFYDDNDDASQPSPFDVMGSCSLEAAAHRGTNLQRACLTTHQVARTANALLEVPDWFKPVAAMLEASGRHGDAYKIIELQLNDDTWKELFATLDANDFGIIVAMTGMGQHRVAEMLARHMCHHGGRERFTCEHAAAAIKATRHRATMAAQLLPICADIASNVSVIRNVLDDFDKAMLRSSGIENSHFLWNEA